MSTNHNQNPEVLSAALGLLQSRRNARIDKALKFIRAAGGLDDSMSRSAHSAYRELYRVAIDALLLARDLQDFVEDGTFECWRIRNELTHRMCERVVKHLSADYINKYL